MEKNAKIYVAGHTGLVGSAIVRNLEAKGHHNILKRNFEDLDLSDSIACENFFQQEKPEYVILAAAKVGGIVANNVYRADFIYENLMIQNNVIHQAYKAGVKKLLFLGSSCIYPKACAQPILEDYLLTDPLEYTNEPYAIAKIAGIKMCESYNIQYGTNFISVMPTNLYGPNDNYDLEKSHVLPALIRKFYLGSCLEKNDWEAIRKDLNKRPIESVSGNASELEIRKILNKYGVKTNSSSVQIELWGSGNPRREFLHSNDMAKACICLLENTDFKDLIPENSDEIRNTHLNIGTGKDLSIRELAETVKEITGFTGEVLWDKSKPDGTFQKLLNVDKLRKAGWQYSIELKDGIRSVFEAYKAE